MAFKTIDLARDFASCQELRAVSFRASYGSLVGFERDYGENYRRRLAQKISVLPQANCHLWLADKIIGQTEAKLVDDPEVGYVNLLAVLPEYQRQGYGLVMVDYLEAQFRQQKKVRMQLSVSPTNHSALAFYFKLGWCSLGQRADNPTMQLMQKTIGNKHE